MNYLVGAALQVMGHRTMGQVLHGCVTATEAVHQVVKRAWKPLPSATGSIPRRWRSGRSGLLKS